MAIDGFLLTLILACLVLGLGITISIAPGLWARRALIASGEDAVRAGRATLRVLGIVCVVGSFIGIGVWVDRVVFVMVVFG